MTEIFLKNPPLLHNPIKYYQLNTNEEFQSRSLKNKNSRIDTRDYFIDLNNLSEQKTEKNYYGTTNMTLVSFKNFPYSNTVGKNGKTVQ